MPVGPVYVTIKSGTPGWAIAIITALLTGVGAFVVGYAIESYKRHRDRVALAASIRAEVTTVAALFEDHGTNLPVLLTFMQNLAAREVAWSEHVVSTFTFLPTVYEKVADRIGALDRASAESVIRFYQLAASFRTNLQLALGPGAVGIESRIKVLEEQLKWLPYVGATARDVERLLDAEASRRWPRWLGKLLR